MLMFVLSFICLGLVLNMVFVWSILSMGITLAVLACFSTVVVSMISTSWFGFITFLIYITGLLVLFGYMLVISPNGPKTKKYNFFSLVVFFVFIQDMGYIGSSYDINYNAFSNAAIQLYEGCNLIFYLIMTCILFLVLILAVFMTYKSPKPMRTFLN